MTEENTSRIFRNNLSKLLIENNMSKTKFAKKLKVSPSTVSMWLNGENSPKMKTLSEIADLFCVDVSYLLIDHSEKIDAVKLFKGVGGLPDTIAAHFDGDEFTEDELNEIRQFAAFVKSKRNIK